MSGGDEGYGAHAGNDAEADGDPGEHAPPGLDLGWTRLQLRRHPDPGPTSLRAYGHAEQALLAVIGELPGPLLLVGDGFGALALGSAGRTRTLVADRATTVAGLRANLARNPQLPSAPPCALATPLAIPAVAADGSPFGAVLLAWPRAHELGFELLRRIGAALPAGTPVVVAGRAEDWGAATLQRLCAALDGAVVERAQQRSRRVRGRLRPGHATAPRVFAGPDGLQLCSLPGVFAHGHVDVGSARLLPLIPTRPPATAIVDLGCGGGVLGLVAALRQPEAEVTFVDDSALAIAAAEASWRANAALLPGRQARFLHACDLEAWPRATADLVVCNPPLHVGRDETRSAAAAMFRDAARILRDDGALWLVANRHLDYPERLRWHFRAVAVVQADARFVVLRARGPR